MLNRGCRSLIPTLLLVCVVGASFFTAAPRASAAVAWHHGFSVPYGAPAGDEEWGRALTAAMGSDTVRVVVAWNDFQTGVNQYNYAALDGVTEKVLAARSWSPYPFDPKALIIFELPATPISWMQEAGYQLTQGEGGGVPRFYPNSIIGQEAYGLAMAKALKYLYDVQIARAIETPNEPNLKNGPAQAVPAEYIGRLGAFGMAYASAEGLPILSPGGPEILVGSVSTNTNTAEASEGKTPAQYFRLVQTSANYWIAWFYLGAPNGQSHAETLMGTWRASFHSYPRLGQGEEFSCQRVTTPQGNRKLQDELGDLTGAAADNEVRTRLAPVVEVLDEVPWKKKWWVTETGMTSYKTTVVNETYDQCVNRRANGGSTYGKNEQASFYQTFSYYMDWFRTYGSYPWKGFEGVTFFMPMDGGMPTGNDPYKGFGAFNPGCGNFCWKPSAIYFADTL
jgi:hypothetical protein